MECLVVRFHKFMFICVFMHFIGFYGFLGFVHGLV